MCKVKMKFMGKKNLQSNMCNTQNTLVIQWSLRRIQKVPEGKAVKDIW